MTTKSQITIMKILWKATEPIDRLSISKAAGMRPVRVDRILNILMEIDCVSLLDDGYVAKKTIAEFGAMNIREIIDTYYDGDTVAFMQNLISIADQADLTALKKHLD